VLGDGTFSNHSIQQTPFTHTFNSLKTIPSDFTNRTKPNYPIASAIQHKPFRICYCVSGLIAQSGYKTVLSLVWFSLVWPVLKN